MDRQTRCDDGNEESVTGNLDAWQNSCLRAAVNDECFRKFRSERAFLEVVEGAPETSAIWNLKRLLKNQKFLKALPLIRQSEYIGSPRRQVLFNDPSGIEVMCSLTPTTVRYANNAANSIDFFGPEILSGKYTIYEIGAGYGGECKVFNDYARALYSRTLEKWTIFDLPTSHGVIKKFLSQFNYSADRGSLDTFEADGPSFVMSNGALSEMRGALLESYVEKVVAPSQYGYFITNFETHSKPFGGWTTGEFLRVLRQMGKSDARELHTESYLSYFDKQARSRLIVFGTDTPTNRARRSFKDVVKILAIQMAYGVTRRLTNRMLFG